MNVSIRSDNLKVSDKLRTHTEKKLAKLDRYLPNISEVHVELARQRTRSSGDLTIAQITLRHGRGAILRAEEKLQGDDNDTAKAAVNAAVDKMYRQIDRFKGKRRRDRKNNDDRYFATPEELGIAEEIPEEEFSEEAVEYADDYADIAEDYAYEIVRRKMIAVTPMSEDEAIDQMELLGHSFFMFFNAQTESINVLYRRQSGGYGVLVPEM